MRRMLSATIFAAASGTGLLALCGVTSTFGMCHRGLSAGSGLVENIERGTAITGRIPHWAIVRRRRKRSCGQCSTYPTLRSGQIEHWPMSARFLT
jgi:hypothetical protein